MYDEKPTASTPPAPHQDLPFLLEALPDALIFIDDAGTVQYANTQAVAMIGASQSELSGRSLWQCAPSLVTIAFYQAVVKALRTRQPLQVKYRSPVTRTRFWVQISPTGKGLAIFFHEEGESTQLQDTFSHAEQLCRDLLESFADRVAILTPDGLVLDINQRSLADAQLRREEVIGKPFTDFPSWHDPATQRHLRAAIARASQGEIACFEARIQPETDGCLDVLLTITSHSDVNQQVEYLICACQDITGRKRTEKELRTLVDAIPHFMWMMLPDGSAEYGNRSWCDYTNMTPEQLQGNGWVQFLHPDDRCRVLDTWRAAVRAGTPYEVEHRIQNGRTGDYRWFLARATPFRDRRGTIQRWLGTCTDIDEQKRAQQRLKESRENWRVLAETIPQLVWTMAPDGSATYFNQHSYDYTDASPEHMLGKKWHQFLHPDDYERTLAHQCYSIETGNSYEIESRLKEGRTGRYRWFLSRATPMRDETGRIVKWLGTSTDIDEQKCIEQALRQSQARVRALIDSNIIGIVSSEGEEEVVVEANDAFLHMSGYTHEEICGRTLSRMGITAPEDTHLFQHARQELATRRQRTSFETELLCKDGSRLPVLVGGVIFQEHPRQVVSFVLDNLAHKELERRKDDFISMANHELRTPLTSLKLQTQLLDKRLAKQGIASAAPALSRMEGQVKQLERLIGELLDVSKIQEGRRESIQKTVNLNELLQEVAETMQQMSETHTIVVRGAAPDLLVGDRDQLAQIFINLLSNAIKYAPDAPLIEVEVSSSAEIVTISVHDQGMGIPREQREKIFERFYRAFDPSQRAVPGLGMGLYVVTKILKHLGGTITVKSEVCQGSTFVVTLPLEKPVTYPGDPTILGAKEEQ